jgi:O-antigen/teichoic acid export membrane protein
MTASASDLDAGGAGGGILRNSTIALVVRLVAAPFGLLVVTLTTRLLSPEDAGRFFVLYSFCSVAAIIIGCGQSMSAVRLVSEALALKSPGRAKQAMYAALRIVAFAAFIYAALLCLPPVQAVLAQLLQFDLNVPILALLFAWTVGLALQSLLAELFRGMHDILRASIFGGLCSSLLSLMALVGSLVLFTPSLLVFVGLVVSATLLASAVAGSSLYRLTRHLPRGPESAWRSVLSLSLPFWGTSVVLVVLGQADLWILNQLSNSESVALYGAATRLTQLLTLPLLVINAALIPVISEQHALGQHQRLQEVLRTSAAMAALPAILALLLFAVAGSWLLGLFFGDVYRQAHGLLVILAAGQCVNVLGGSAGYTLLMTGHQRDMFLITVASGAAMCVLAVALGSQLGATGVAIGAATGLAVQSLVMCWAVWRRLGLITLASPAAFLRPLHTLKALA